MTALLRWVCLAVALGVVGCDQGAARRNPPTRSWELPGASYTAWWDPPIYIHENIKPARWLVTGPAGDVRSFQGPRTLLARDLATLWQQETEASRHVVLRSLDGGAP